ncbi:unnamed protein product [Caenorhabditis bovis]|uniref:Uncharacterized protein n=1 Tax=Caenorhabditis bovis TaxID=2654633 RepID=A0A8S1FBF4_9PELO|nr:unnamed protein product [Caenorhabditis bovis]
MTQSAGTERRVNFPSEEPLTLGEKLSHRMEQFKEMVSSGCCSCASKCPSIAIVLVTAFVLLLVLAAIPLTLMLTSSTQKLSSDLAILDKQTRNPKFWPKIDKIGSPLDGDSDDDYRGISMMALFPPNVSMCSGFGFACTDAVHRVIPTSQRCDGKYDCNDKSDEENCKSCQTIFSCSSKIIPPPAKKGQFQPKPSLICLTASQLCDGVEHCPDGSDETKFCKSTCDKNEFTCPGKNICLPESAQCNGINDCEDGSDEKNCNECGKDSHKCGKICVKPSEICDGVAQCKDGSDEKKCDCKTCSGSDKALCDDGTCILRSQVCDGKRDCKNGMDEQDCPGSCATKAILGKRITCADGRKYTEEEACSGEFEVCNSSCPKCDKRTAFECPNASGGAKKCIPRKMVCDGFSDCADGADEQNCDCDLSSGNQFKCLNSRTCIDSSRRCDGIQDCHDSSDEKECDKCLSGALQCKIDKTCLPQSARCDGVTDCSDGSDEKACSCDECVGKHSTTYMCDGSSRCLRRDDVCSPYSTCPNATRTDRAYCASMALKDLNNLPW